MATDPNLGFTRPQRGDPLVIEVIDEALRVIADAVVNGIGGSTLRGSLISAWRLDEASGTRVDAFGSNHLADNNTVTQAVGKLGFGAQFTSANSEYLSIADNAALSTGDIDFTVAGWVYFDTVSTGQGLVGKWSVAGQLEYLIRLEATNRLRLYVSNNGTAIVSIENTAVIAALTWYYIVAWHDSVANTINIQINNGTAASTGHTTGVFNGTSAFVMGRNDSGPGDYVNGRLDEWLFWKRVLTADERTALYNGGSGLAWPL